MSRGKFKELFKKCLPIIIFIAVMAALTLIFLPDIQRLGTDEGRESFKLWVDGIGFFGWLATLGIQLLQIFIALIPGEPVELMLGYVWGPWLGTLTCLLGIFIGTSVIFLLVRKFGTPFVRRIVGDRDLTKYSFLSDPAKIDMTVFILFFIPGTPKDALTYIVPLMPMSPVKYLLISTLARIPSVVTSTILGDSIADGDYLMAVIVFAITALISVLGIIFGNRYVRIKRESKTETESSTSLEAEQGEAAAEAEELTENALK